MLFREILSLSPKILNKLTFHLIENTFSVLWGYLLYRYLWKDRFVQREKGQLVSLLTRCIETWRWRNAWWRNFSWFGVWCICQIWTHSVRFHSFSLIPLWYFNKVICITLQECLMLNQSLSLVRLFATPWISAREASLFITNSQSSLRLMSIEQWCHPAISSSVVPFSSCP